MVNGEAPRFSKAEEAELVRQLRSGDKESRDQAGEVLYRSVFPWAIHVVRRATVHDRLTPDDIEQLAHDATAEAVATCDPGKGRLTTHIQNCARTVIQEWRRPRERMKALRTVTVETDVWDYRMPDPGLLAQQRRNEAKVEARAIRAAEISDLTPRERQVWEGIRNSIPNDVMASQLGVTVKWVEHLHRSVARKIRHTMGFDGTVRFRNAGPPVVTEAVSTPPADSDQQPAGPGLSCVQCCLLLRLREAARDGRSEADLGVPVKLLRPMDASRSRALARLEKRGFVRRVNHVNGGERHRTTHVLLTAKGKRAARAVEKAVRAQMVARIRELSEIFRQPDQDGEVNGGLNELRRWAVGVEG